MGKTKRVGEIQNELLRADQAVDDPGAEEEAARILAKADGGSRGARRRRATVRTLDHRRGGTSG